MSATTDKQESRLILERLLELGLETKVRFTLREFEKANKDARELQAAIEKEVSPNVQRVTTGVKR